MRIRRLLTHFNLVTITLAAIVAGGGYAGWKFIPPYYQAHKVDNALTGIKWEASEIPAFGGGDPADAILQKLRAELVGMGIDQRYLKVWFESNYTSVHARYVVFVEHPFEKTTTLKFHRVLEIPQD